MRYSPSRYSSLVPQLCLLLALVASISCQNKNSNAPGKVEKLAQVRPNLPEVPQLPPPEFDITYPDKSYSVYGLRKRVRQTMDRAVELTATVVEVYEPPRCERREACGKAKMPHITVADKAGERDIAKRLLVVGYAEHHDDVIAALQRGKAQRGANASPEKEGIAGDFHVGDRIWIKGTFSRLSSLGFNSSEGLLQYTSHRLLPPAAPQR